MTTELPEPLDVIAVGAHPAGARRMLRTHHVFGHPGIDRGVGGSTVDHVFSWVDRPFEDPDIRAAMTILDRNGDVLWTPNP